MTELHGFDRVEALAAEAEEHYSYSSPDKPRCLAFEQGFSAASLMAMQFAPINYVIPGYIAEGVTVFAGAPKIGKSWMVLGMAIAVASGDPAFGSIPCTQGDVLYLALEDNPRRLQSRLHKMGVTRAPDRLTFCTQWPSLDEGAVEHVEAWIASVQRPAMVVVDVLAKVRPAANGRDSQYDADYRTLVGLQELAGKHGLAIVAVHHTRKMDADDPFDSVSGTRGLTGAADTVMVLKRDSGSGRSVLYGRGRDVEEIETAVEFDRDRASWSIVGQVEELAKTDNRQEIIDVLRDSAEPLTPREISDLIGQTYDGVRRTLTRMFKDQEVEKSGRGQYVCKVSQVSQVTMGAGDCDIVTDVTGFDVTGQDEGWIGLSPRQHAARLKG